MGRGCDTSVVCGGMSSCRRVAQAGEAANGSGRLEQECPGGPWGASKGVRAGGPCRAVPGMTDSGGEE